MTDAERLSRVLDFTMLNIRQLGMALELKQIQTLYDIKNGKIGISKMIAEKIKEKFEDFNLSWLMFGEGEMLTRSTTVTQNNVNGANNYVGVGAINAGCGESSAASTDEIPVIPRQLYEATDIDVYEYVTENDVPTSPKVEQFPKHDLYYNVYSDEMSPDINKGDKLAIAPYEIGMERKVVDNRVYVVDTKYNGMMLRKLYKIENGFRAEPINTAYSTEIIESDDVIRVYRVLGLLRTNI